jgi:energy-coupling factor transporter ATP-binding protein EcfA2
VLQSRPLYDNPSDAKLHVPAPQLDAIERAMRRGNNTVIYGARGAGKTTLLRQFQLALRDREEPVVFIDAAAIGETLELAERIRDALKGRPGLLRGGIGGVAGAQLLGDPSPPPGGVSRALYDTLVGLGEDAEPTTILLDASASAGAIYGLFGRMRDTIWQLPHHWLVAVDESDRASVLKPPADAFFDTVVQLAPRSAEELAEIVRRRTDDLPEGLVSRIAGETRGNPRATIRAANDAVVNGEDPASDLEARARLSEAASLLGRPHGMLMAELLDLGQASPSDDAVQERLGLTRGRINVLLQDLQEKGLVETDVERSAGPGRPRTIYRPVLGATR